MSILHFSVVKVTEHPQRGTKTASVVLQWNNAASEGEEPVSLEVSEGTVVQFCLPMGVDGVKKKDLGSTEEHTFVLTGGDAKRFPGFCRTFYPAKPLVGDKRRFPMVLALVTEDPWHSFFFKVLHVLEGLLSTVDCLLPDTTTKELPLSSHTAMFLTDLTSQLTANGKPGQVIQMRLPKPIDLFGTSPYRLLGNGIQTTDEYLELKVPEDCGNGRWNCGVHLPRLLWHTGVVSSGNASMTSGTALTSQLASGGSGTGTSLNIRGSISSLSAGSMVSGKGSLTGGMAGVQSTGWMSTLVGALLLEKRVVLTSDQWDTLSACVQAAGALIYPFQWQHIFVPLLPESLKDYLSAPMPFLIGLPAKLLNRLRYIPMEDVCMFDLDKTTRAPIVVEPELPWKAELDAALAEVHRRIRSPTESETTPLIACVMQEYFLKLFGNYQQFIHEDTPEQNEAWAPHRTNNPSNAFKTVPSYTSLSDTSAHNGSKHGTSSSPRHKHKPSREDMRTSNPGSDSDHIFRAHGYVFEHTAFVNSRRKNETARKFLKAMKGSQLYAMFVHDRLALAGSGQLADCTEPFEQSVARYQQQKRLRFERVLQERANRITLGPGMTSSGSFGRMLQGGGSGPGSGGSRTMHRRVDSAEHLLNFDRQLHAPLDDSVLVIRRNLTDPRQLGGAAAAAGFDAASFFWNDDEDLQDLEREHQAAFTASIGQSLKNLSKSSSPLPTQGLSPPGARALPTKSTPVSSALTQVHAAGSSTAGTHPYQMSHLGKEHAAHDEQAGYSMQSSRQTAMHTVSHLPGRFGGPTSTPATVGTPQLSMDISSTPSMPGGRRVTQQHSGASGVGSMLSMSLASWGRSYTDRPLSAFNNAERNTQTVHEHGSQGGAALPGAGADLHNPQRSIPLPNIGPTSWSRPMEAHHAQQQVQYEVVHPVELAAQLASSRSGVFTVMPTSSLQRSARTTSAASSIVAQGPGRSNNNSGFKVEDESDMGQVTIGTDGIQCIRDATAAARAGSEGVARSASSRSARTTDSGEHHAHVEMSSSGVHVARAQSGAGSSMRRMSGAGAQALPAGGSTSARVSGGGLKEGEDRERSSARTSASSKTQPATPTNAMRMSLNLGRMGDKIKETASETGSAIKDLLFSGLHALKIKNASDRSQPPATAKSAPGQRPRYAQPGADLSSSGRQPRSPSNSSSKHPHQSGMYTPQVTGGSVSSSTAHSCFLPQNSSDGTWKHLKKSIHTVPGVPMTSSGKLMQPPAPNNPLPPKQLSHASTLERQYTNTSSSTPHSGTPSPSKYPLPGRVGELQQSRTSSLFGASRNPSALSLQAQDGSEDGFSMLASRSVTTIQPSRAGSTTVLLGADSYSAPLGHAGPSSAGISPGMHTALSDTTASSRHTGTSQATLDTFDGDRSLPQGSALSTPSVSFTPQHTPQAAGAPDDLIRLSPQNTTPAQGFIAAAQQAAVAAASDLIQLSPRNTPGAGAHLQAGGRELEAAISFTPAKGIPEVSTNAVATPATVVKTPGATEAASVSHVATASDLIQLSPPAGSSAVQVSGPGYVATATAYVTHAAHDLIQLSPSKQAVRQ